MRRERSHRPDLPRQKVLEDLSWIVAFHRASSRQSFVQHRADRPDVGAMVDVRIAEKLLGCHVAGGTEHVSCDRDFGCGESTLTFGELRNSEIEHANHDLSVFAREEDILRLQISMNDSGRMRGADGRNDREHQTGNRRERAGRFAGKVLREGLAAQKCHHHHGHVLVDIEDVVHFDDVRVASGRRGPRLAQEPPSHLRLAPDSGDQKLHRDGRLRDEVRGGPDRTHPAVPQFPIQPIAIRDHQTATKLSCHGGKDYTNS
jgi:hypothetical protein